MKVLGVIPARGGSKRVPGKNIKLLNGYPLIGYTIDVAKKAAGLTSVIVSTDSEEIAKVSKDLGGNVPFIRPSEMATDTSDDRSFLIHALTWYEKNHKTVFDAVCLLRPTSPFRTSKLIEQAIELLDGSDCDSVRSMTPVSGVHHPYWMFKEKDGLADNLVEGVSLEKYYQSQLLPEVFRLNGCVDIIKTACLLDDNKPLYGHRMKILNTTEKEAIDIDTPEDFEYCEWLMTKQS